ncbi:MAG: hypothetical protein KZQ58_10370 [gamma proteobacterium symbiont of Bathyaustriella thionipta]|nr:hypothetical protein [gamma proteobacterium symbiont of Bathyaustriella thionipta]
MTNKKTIKAFLISPVVAPFVYFLGAVVLMTISTAKAGYLGAFVFIMSIGLPISYFSTLVLGFPIYKVLERTGYLSPASLIFSGAITGALVFLIFISSLGRADFETSEIIKILFFGAIMGASVAFTFGKLAV